MSDEELEVKFRTNAGRALPAKQVEELRCALEAVGEADTVGDVMRLAGTRDSVRSDWGTPEANLPTRGVERRSAISYYVPGFLSSAMSRRSSARVSVMSPWYVSEARMTEITVISAIAAVLPLPPAEAGEQGGSNERRQAAGEDRGQLVTQRSSGSAPGCRRARRSRPLEVRT